MTGTVSPEIRWKVSFLFFLPLVNTMNYVVLGPRNFKEIPMHPPLSVLSNKKAVLLVQ